jgi:AraC-like DNA-binding protein
LIGLDESPNKFRFKGLPDDRITVEHFRQQLSDSKPVPVEKHTHDFCELIFVKNGLCEHIFKDTRVTLMSNDALLVMPNQAHEFIFSESIDIYNCQFYLDELQGVFIDIVNSLSFPNLRSTAFEFSNPDTLLTLPMTIPVPADQPETSRYAPLNMQGIIHTSYTQALYLEGLFEKIITEQTDRLLRYSYVVKNCLEEVLIVIERIMASQFQYDQDIPQKHKTIIENVLAYVDTHYQEPLNFSDIAAAQNLSPNYFRKIFKTYTGTSPVDHLNRIRVLKALELLRDHKRLSSSGAAEQVGILDANYFTRLFKKYIGFPPSHFTRNRPV